MTSLRLNNSISPRLRPVVAIVGRPNVGKSTLFNRLVGGRQAITDDQPGVTRDLLYAEAEWDGTRFTIVDTGGYVPRSQDALQRAVCEQAHLAISEADLVLLLTDVTMGLTDLDRQLATILRQAEQPCVVVVNKVDSPEHPAWGLEEFYALGLGEPIPVSAATGKLSGNLLDTVVKHFGELPQCETSDRSNIRVVIVGRPNVGKSTLINRLAGFEVSIVDEAPGTTRDATNIVVDWREHRFCFVDTAGMRRRSRVHNRVEYYSGLRAANNIGMADVVLLLIDSQEGCTVQDVRIASQVVEKGRGLLLGINKWDLTVDRENAAQAFLKGLHREFPFLIDYPAAFISGLTGRHLERCLQRLAVVYTNCHQRVVTSRLNELIERTGHVYSPTRAGQELRVFYATQYGVAPPSFSFFSNRPDLLADSHKRFWEKKIREEFGFEGTPIRCYWRRRGH